MVRLLFAALIFGFLTISPFAGSSALAGEAVEKAAAEQRARDIREYIDAITKAMDENLHSCAGDRWEKDEDLNADSGITEADLEYLLNPPQS